MDVCPVCCENFNKVRRSPTECDACGYNACHDCVKRYLVSSVDEPRCMKCHASWKLSKYLICKPSFLKSPEFLRHCEELLYAREYARRSELFERYTRVKTKRAMGDLVWCMRTLLNSIYRVGNSDLQTHSGVRPWHVMWTTSVSNFHNYKLDVDDFWKILPPEVNQIRKSVVEIMNRFNELLHSDENYWREVHLLEVEGPLIYRPYTPWYSGGHTSYMLRIMCHSDGIPQREILDLHDEFNHLGMSISRFIEKYYEEGDAPLPRRIRVTCTTPGCVGLCDSGGHCVICNGSTCIECLRPSSPDHICNSDDLATISMIRRDTTSCPTCNTAITKSSGCDLGWCTQCHTMFSFESGERRYGKNHNPEYYDYYRRVVGDLSRDPQDGLADPGQVVEYDDNERVMWLTRRYKAEDPSSTLPTPTMLNLGLSLQHLSSTFPIMLPYYSAEEKRQSLSFGYFEGIMSEEQYKRALVNNERQHERLELYQNHLNPSLVEIRIVLDAFLRNQYDPHDLVEQARIVVDKFNLKMKKLSTQIKFKHKLLVVGPDTQTFPTPAPHWI